MTEWNLPPSPPIVADSASNTTMAAEELGTSLHVGRLAHTLNLACGKALKITSVLKEKQRLLQLPEHNLVVDVATRWNSALHMMSRYLEQQPAIYAPLLHLRSPIKGKKMFLHYLKEILHLLKNCLLF